MNFIEKLMYRRIKFSGWQMPLFAWRRWSDAVVPKDTEYLGSFSVDYKGKPTDTYVDIYIIEESGIIEALVHTRGEKFWGSREKVVEK